MVCCRWLSSSRSPLILDASFRDEREHTTCTLLSSIRASTLCIQNVDVPVGPATDRGWAVVLRLSGIKTGWFVGNTCIVATRVRLIEKGEHLPSFPFQPSLIHHHPSVFQSHAAWVFFPRASTLGIQIADVPVGPATSRGLAVILRPFGIKAGWFVGSTRFPLCR